MFEILKTKIITEIVGAEKDSSEIIFKCQDGTSYAMDHTQDCCESVSVEDVIGDVKDLLNTPILLAEVVTEDDANAGECGQWTFYKLATVKGDVTFRWYGSSNGYYSIEVSFSKIDPVSRYLYE